MDPLREIGKVLLVVGIVLIGAGALLMFGARLALSSWPLARRHLLSRPPRQLLFPDRDLHLSERRAHAHILDCEFLPPLIL